MNALTRICPGPLKRALSRKPTVAVLRLHGPIGMGGRFSRGISDAALADVIERAFASKPKAVALSLNSPGGSPVQSSLVAGRIRRLAEEKDIPVYAYVEDVAASGGYWLACAADEIMADPASILGSIGVIHASFGFQDLIARHGVERRVHATGANKAFMDPFSPEDPEHAKRLEAMLHELQEVFTDHVKARRGERLVTDAEELFDGRVWTAAKARELGLIDGIAAMKPDLQARFGKKVRLRLFAPKQGLFSRFGGGGAEALSEAAAAGALAAAEERALWARWGL
ncbi:S49 family peptidase [Rhodovulum sp. DZ06]|uniref:S49 family peptidase n=1 Tax=Rhodovulum sp. DZ06 TaxID=3425126 RepID=UPI003D3434A0